MMNVDIEFPQNCVRRNAAQEHIQTSSASVSEAYLKASCSKAPSARTLGVVSGRAPSSLQVLERLACSSSLLGSKPAHANLALGRLFYTHDSK